MTLNCLIGITKAFKRRPMEAARRNCDFIKAKKIPVTMDREEGGFD